MTTAARQPRDGRGRYQKHGLHTLKKAVRILGSRALPSKSTALGRALHEWRTALVGDLGGEGAISTQQRALVELAVRTKLLVDSVDAYVLAMPSPVNRQKHCLFPVVRERQALVAQLQAILRDLGLERRAKPVPSLAEYLAKKDAEPKMDIPPRPPSESRPSSTVLKPFSSSSSEEIPKMDAPQVSRGETEDDGS